MAKTKTDIEDEFLTVREVTEKLRISRYTVYRLIHAGEFDHKRFGRCIRITKESFKRYLANA